MASNKLGISIMAVFTASAAFAGPLQDAAKVGDLTQVEQELSNGADINEEDEFGTALHWAAMNAHLEIIELLVKNGANTELVTGTLGTPMHAAVLRGQPSSISKLIQLGADPDSRKADDQTPLTTAVGGNRLEVVRALIAGGADVNAVINPPVQNSGNQFIGQVTGLHLALLFKRPEIAGELIDAGAAPFPVTPAPIDISTGDPERGRDAANSWCFGCHRIEANSEMFERSAQFAGPSLVNVFGRAVGSEQGFEYSPSLLEFGGVWDESKLFAYVTAPMLTVPGTKMTWREAWSDQEVADIISFLKEQAE